MRGRGSFAAVAPLGLLLATTALAGCGSTTANIRPGTISVVAAENQYGSIARTIGGKYVTVTSLLTNPNTDPHEFEASAGTAETVSRAQLVIKNGLGYDTWVDKLLGASPRPGRIVFSVGSFLGKKTGANPHVWYEPAGWPKVAGRIAADLSRLAPSHKAYFQTREASWLKTLQPIYSAIAQVRKLTAGQRVIATEPVYGYMLAALGATSLDPTFQRAIMNGTDPPPSSVARFETDLRDHRARMLFYNSQVSDPTANTMRAAARQSGIPIVGVTETQPPNLTFLRWQDGQLKAIVRAWPRG
ncbi:MAG TPA: zinc ABC transporter substrate-binding protein [Chloroflexota bacterium]|nr:zinc ABC transporter substrate-binding protein [Chloroflexota bacterium]